jgi:dihydrofolate synthase/folylpolyglutamate synthase
MNYQETISYLYQRLPAFHRVGASAMKSGLHNITVLCEALGNPHEKFKSMHVAGTNGKGSTSHMLSAVLQSAGYKVGLHTSPHLKSFTERFKINGIPCSEQTIVDFVAKHQALIEEVQPSFFEISVALCFDYFACEKVDIGIIEVGLGGRLDSTNIITPILSVITNISFDHTDLLGDTLGKISAEKAGIIKPNVPVVISETQPETKEVFKRKALETQSPLYFADQSFEILESKLVGRFREVSYKTSTTNIRTLKLDLLGKYQAKNVLGVVKAIEVLNQLGWEVSDEEVHNGLKNTIPLSQLQGRWQVLQEQPMVVADVAHNYGGLEETLTQINQYSYSSLRFVLGFVKDKDVKGVLELFPKEAIYYFCAAELPRSLPAEDLRILANGLGLQGKSYVSVREALQTAKDEALYSDFIHVGGSTFVVSEI